MLLFSSKSARLILIAFFFITLFFALTWVNYRYLTGLHRYNNRDFMSLWAGGKAILAGVNPYDPTIWESWRIQLGSSWIPDSREPFPLWTLLPFLLFSLLDLGWGAASWLAVSLFMFGGALALLNNAFNPQKLSLLAIFLFVLGAAVYRGGILTLVVGQLTYELFFIITLYLILDHRKRPFAAGLVLACVIFKPNPFILFIPLIGLWFIVRRRWATIGGAAVGGIILMGVSWLVLPGWFFQWMHVTGKTDVTPITPTIWGAAHELTSSWWVMIGFVMLVVVTAVTGYYLFTNKRITTYEAVSLALAASILTTPYAWEYEHLLLLIPWTLIFFRLRQKSKWGALSLWTAGVIVLPWAMYIIAVSRELGTFTAVVPFLTLLLTYGAIRFLKSENSIPYGTKRSDPQRS